MLEKFAEDDKLEQLSAQRRRMKAEEHRRSVAALLETRRAAREEARAVERAEDTELAQREAERVTPATALHHTANNTNFCRPGWWRRNAPGC